MRVAVRSVHDDLDHPVQLAAGEVGRRRLGRASGDFVVVVGEKLFGVFLAHVAVEDGPIDLGQFDEQQAVFKIFCCLGIAAGARVTQAVKYRASNGVAMVILTRSWHPLCL